MSFFSRSLSLLVIFSLLLAHVPVQALQHPNNKSVVETELDNDRFFVSLKEAKSQGEQIEALTTPLPAERTKELLANWAQYQTEIPISKEPIEKNLLTAVLDRQPPPAVSSVQAFNSKTSVGGRSDVAAPHTELTVLSVSPMNSGVRAQTITIRFSEQMVPLSTIGTTIESPLDIKISPSLKGHWEWLDPQTLNFKSDTDHFPMATAYTVSVGTSLKSVAGTALSSPFEWHFSTAPVSAMSLVPSVVTNKYYVPLFFDQHIEPNDVFKHITVKYKKKKLSAALVDESEIQNEFPKLQDFTIYGDDLIFLKIQDIVPPESSVEVSLSRDCPSKEGPLLSDDVLKINCIVGHRNKPEIPFAFVPRKDMVRPRPLGQNIALAFNSTLGEVDIRKYVVVEPALKNETIYRQNSEVIISGLPIDKTQHKVRILKDLPDINGRTLPRDVLIPLSFGPIPPILLNSSTGRRETIPSKRSSSYALYSVNVPALRVRVFKLSEARIYPKLPVLNESSDSSALCPGGSVQDSAISSEEKERLAKLFFPEPDKDFLIYPNADPNQICKSEVQLGDMLSNGCGQLRLVVQAYSKDAARQTEKYLAAVAKSKTKATTGKSALKIVEADDKKNKSKTQSRAAMPPSYNPARGRNRLINARIGEQNHGGPGGTYSVKNGVFETTLQFTNLAASTIEGPDGKLYCRVTELGTGLPIEGAKVRFVRNPYVWNINRSKRPNECILENVVECAEDSVLEPNTGMGGGDSDQSPVLETGAQGMVSFPAVQLKARYADEFKKDSRASLFNRSAGGYYPNALVVSHDNDVLYVEDVQPGLRAQDENLNFCCTDRNLYKPGETVDVKGWFRTRAILPYADLQPSSVKFRRIYYSILSSRREIATGDTELGYLDSVQFRFGLPNDMDLGDATIQIFSDAKHMEPLAQTQFKVEEFRAPEFEITVKQQNAAPKYINESANFVVKANYFGSGPLTGAQVDWTVRLQNASFTPTNWSTYCFQNNERLFNRTNDQRRPKKIQIPAQFKGKTDKDGRHTLEVLATTYDGTQPVMINAEATVRDLSQQRWAGSESCLLHPATIYVGLTSDKTGVPQGDELEGQLVAVDVDGKIVAGTGVELQLFRQIDGMEQRNRSELVSVQTVTFGTEPAKFRFQTKDIGSYYVVASVKDKRGRRHESSLRYTVYQRPTRETTSGQSVNAAARVFKVEPNKREYRAGDVAEIVITSPTDKFTGWAVLLDRGVQKVVPFRSTTGQYVLNVPLKGESIPQCRVRVEIIPEVDATHATVSQAYSTQVMLPISSKSRELSVVAKPRSLEILPGQYNTIDFQVSKSDGRPAANADLCAIVVDEAVLALTNYQWRNPLESFYHSRGLGLLGQLIERDSRFDATSNNEFGSVYQEWKSKLTPEMIQRYWPLQGFNTNRGRIGFLPDGNGRIGFDVLNGQAIQFQKLLLKEQPLAQLESVDRYTFFPSPRARQALFPDRTSRGRRDSNLFQVEPTVIDERHYSSGRDERHQKMSPNLPGGTPIPDSDGHTTPVSNVRIRTNFGPLALFKPNLKTDKDGRASVTFTAPDSLTRYRVIALVAQEEKYFGKTEANFAVDQPLTLRPALPRFANVADKFDVPIVVTNSGNKKSTIEIAGCAEGAAEGKNGYKVDLEPDQRASVLIHTTSKFKGIAQFRCVARAQSGFADKMVRVIPVIESPTTEQFAQYGTISGGAVNEEIQLPDESRTSGAMLDLKTSASAISELHAAAAYLKAYPYGCSEQLSSQILVFAAIKGMPKELGQMLATHEELLREQDVVDELAKRMLPNGTFTLWGEQNRHGDQMPFLTAHCAHAMLMAKQAGYKVDENLMKTIRSGLKIPHFRTDKQSEEFHQRARAYIIYVRSLLGDESVDEALNILPDEKSIRDAHTEVLCWLLPVIQKHDPEKAKQILARLYNATEETASTAFVRDKQPETLYLFCAEGSSRATALTLEALCFAQPDHPLIPKLAKGLLLDRGHGHWLNTNDDAFAFSALSKYFFLYEKDNPNFAVDAWFDGLHYVHSKFTKRTAPPMLATFKLDSNAPVGSGSAKDKLLANGSAKRNLVLCADGPGRLYYRIGLRYALKNPIQKSLDRGIHITREYTGAYDRSDVAVQDDGTVLVKKGATIKITAHVYSPGERFYSALVDHLPAGFESVNTSLNGTAQAENAQQSRFYVLRHRRRQTNEEKGEKKAKEEIFEAPYFDWNSHQNLRDDRTEVFRDSMSSGHYVYSYLARATTCGTFLAPPMKIEEMYTPETFGRTNSMIVKVVDEVPAPLVPSTAELDEDDATVHDDRQPQIYDRNFRRQLSPTLPEGSPIPDNE